jgi:hypothetical protein
MTEYSCEMFSNKVSAMDSSTTTETRKDCEQLDFNFSDGDAEYEKMTKIGKGGFG